MGCDDADALVLPQFMRTRCLGIEVVRAMDDCRTAATVLSEVSLQGESKSLSSSLLGIMFSDTSLDFSSIWESDGLLSGRAAARFGDAFDDKVRELNNLHEVCLRNRTTAAQSERERQIKIWSNKYRAGTLGEGYGSTSSEVIRYEQKEQERKRELLSSLKDAAAEARARKRRHAQMRSRMIRREWRLTGLSLSRNSQ